MFEAFELQYVDVGEVTLRTRYGGHGTPVVLLHGHPRTHTTWHRVAPRLADSFFVVCPDLRGYGQSTLPPDAPEHAQSSKRAMGTMWSRSCVTSATISSPSSGMIAALWLRSVLRWITRTP
jgi:pimeloyl-ACP methyl ester carboxylesterase